MRKTVLAILAFFAFFLCSLAVTSGKMERPDVEPHACFAAADYGRLWPIMASPFGGMPRHCHDMLAGFFPDDSIGKTLKGIGMGMGLEAGWLIVLLSFLYNVFCALSGCSGTVPYSGFGSQKSCFLRRSKERLERMIRKTKFVFASLCLGLLCLGAADVLSADGLKTHTNSIGMEFVLIPAGSFMMGTDLDAEEGLTDRNVEEGFNDEWVQHSVTISTPFYLGKYEVTQAQWEAMMGGNPSRFKGPDNPVEQVSWDDVQEFIRRLNAKEGHNRYRLPTEMEWELAARGGTNTRWFFGDSENALGRYAWFDGNSGDKTHPVGRKKPNPYALYDIYGNVWEWCQDWYGNYPRTTVTDPRGPANGSDRVSRGGAWSIYAEYCQSARRYGNPPDIGYVNVGFRLALSLK